jgi:hypothetical protein
MHNPGRLGVGGSNLSLRPSSDLKSVAFLYRSPIRNGTGPRTENRQIPVNPGKESQKRPGSPQLFARCSGPLTSSATTAVPGSGGLRLTAPRSEESDDYIKVAHLNTGGESSFARRTPRQSKGDPPATFRTSRRVPVVLPMSSSRDKGFNSLEAARRNKVLQPTVIRWTSRSSLAVRRRGHGVRAEPGATASIPVATSSRLTWAYRMVVLISA